MRACSFVAAFGTTVSMLGATPVCAQPFAYVLESSPAALRVINASTGREHSLIALIRADGSPAAAPNDLAVSPDGRRAFVTTADDLIVVDTENASIIGRLPNIAPAGIATSPDGTRIYVSRKPPLRDVLTLDAASLATLFSAGIGLADPHSIVAAPDGGSIYVYAACPITSYGSRCPDIIVQIFTPRRFPSGVITWASPRTVMSIAEPSTGSMALSGDGQRLVVGRAYGVSMLDVPTGSVTEVEFPSQCIPPYLRCQGAVAVAMTRRGDRVFASTTQTLMVHRTEIFSIDTATNTVVDRLLQQTGAVISAVAVSESGATLYAAGQRQSLDRYPTPYAFMAVDVLANAVAVAAPISFPIRLAVSYSSTACVYDVTTSHPQPFGSGGDVAIGIPAPAGCSWTVAPDQDALNQGWLRYSGPLAGTGAESLNLSVLPSDEPHRAVFTIAGQRVVIDQTLPSMAVDVRPFSVVRQPSTLAGWAIQRDATSETDSGVAAIHVWAYPADGSAPRFVGWVGPDGRTPRSDIAARYGARYLNSGFALTIRGLPSGTYSVAFFAQGARSATFDNLFVVPLIVLEPLTELAFDPLPPGRIDQPFQLTGWAFDFRAAAGTGVNTVHVWAWPVTGGAPVFLGAADYGWPRPEIENLYGPQFAATGFHVAVNTLPAGRYYIVAYALSSATGRFDRSSVVLVDVAPPADVAVAIDPPAVWTVPTGAYTLVSGWAIDFRAAEPACGVNVVHIWAYPTSGGDPIFYGWDTVRFWSNATNNAFRRPVCGFLVQQIGFLPSGAYTLVTYAYSTVTGSFAGARVTSLIVQ